MRAMASNYRRFFGILALTAALVAPVFAFHHSAGNPSNKGYLGIEMRDISEDQVAVLKLKEAHGAEIVNMDHDGPACKAGLQIHDVIVQMNGQAVDGTDQLRRMLHELPVGSLVVFVVSRDGQQTSISTQLANRDAVERQAWEQRYKVPEPEIPSSSYVPHGNTFLGSSTATGATKGQKSFLGLMPMLVSSSFTGAKLEVMGPQLAQFFGAQGSAGLLVRSVDTNSPAWEAGLRAGDVVVKVNSLSVASGSDWSKTIHENRGKPVPVVILRDKKEQTLTLTPDSKKRSSVEDGMGLEEFFGSGEQAERTRETLAELQPLFDQMAAEARRRMEAVRYAPDTTGMMVVLEKFEVNPELQIQLEIARRQVDAAADAAKRAADSAESRQRMN
jgi:serine protease Do